MNRIKELIFIYLGIFLFDVINWKIFIDNLRIFFFVNFNFLNVVLFFYDNCTIVLRCKNGNIG